MEKILYNLSFLPNLEYLDISKNILREQEISKCVENLERLLSINPFIETIILSDIEGIFDAMNLKFFKVLARNTSLRTLDLTNTRTYSGKSSQIAQKLAKSLAFNKINQGKIVNLYLGKNSLIADSFFGNMFYSNNIKEKWYGSSKKANEMVGEDLVKHYECQLEILDLEGAKFSLDNYNPNKIKKGTLKYYPKSMNLFLYGASLKHLSLKRAKLPSKYFESLHSIFTYGHQSGITPKLNYKKLDLSYI